MKLRSATIDFLSNDMSQRGTGKELVRFFNGHGFDDDINRGFGLGASKYSYVQENFARLNFNGQLVDVLKDFYSPINFIKNPEWLETFTNDLNKYLKFDALHVEILDNEIRFSQTDGNLIKPTKLDEINHEYIAEQIQKCNIKVLSGDYSGAITNARSLVEHLLEHIYTQVSGNDFTTDKLPKKYEEVQKVLNLAPKEYSSSEIKSILSGFIAIINGMACFRNDWSDSHARKYNPEKHHAVLAVNSALTVSEFLYSSFEYQKQKGKEVAHT